MRKSITFLFLIAAIGVKAQTKVISKDLGDSIIVNKGAFEIKHIIVTAKGDTARSVSWCTDQMRRDTTIGFNINVFFYDKTGTQISNIGLSMNPLTNVSGYLNLIDSQILQLNPRIIKP